MIKITKGSKIQSNKFKTIHIVEHVETVDDLTLVYTEDIKCFPMSEVTYFSTINEKLCNLFKKWVGGKNVEIKEDSEEHQELKKLLTVNYGIEKLKNDFKKSLESFEQKKIQVALPPGN